MGNCTSKSGCMVMRQKKYQTAETMIYTHCTIEEVVDEVFDQIRPTAHDKESICINLRSGASSQTVIRNDVENGTMYSAVIWNIDEYEHNGYEVLYITEYFH